MESGDRRYREITITAGEGVRLDRWLALRFSDRSRSLFARAIRQGLVHDAADRPLAPSHRVSLGELLRVYVPGIAPGDGPPPFPPILYEDERLVVVDKPSGLLSHPAGSNFAWALISLAKARWPSDRVDLVHRLDRDTSGVMMITRDVEANRHLKDAVARGGVLKEYEALVRGEVPWQTRECRGPIGPARGEIRVQMAVCDDGLRAHTDVTVVARQPTLSRVRCVLHTGRTHQIRVHLAHEGHPVLGDRLYGVPADVFLRTLEHGADDTVLTAAGAPHHALHARRITLPHPDGPTVTVEAPFPDDLERWWRDPSVLPLDRPTEPHSSSTVQ